ncbi:MAG: DNA translocase FtsK [Oscillospiraceae bacterium]|nr:DNA translocase FtsK [Oscillospiraceae bacterium]
MPAQKKTSKAAAKPAGRRLIRREVGALACFLLAVFTGASLFGAQAWLLDRLRLALEWFVGDGFMMLPFASLAAAGALLFHRAKPVALRTVCVFTVPALTGMMIGMFAAERDTWHPAAYWLARWLRVGLSAPVAVVLLLAGICICLFIFLRLSPVAVADAIRNRPRRDYEEPDSPPPRPPAPDISEPPPVRPPAKKEKKRPDYDIPVYAGPDSEPEEPPPAGILPARGETVKTPGEIAAEPDGLRLDPIPPAPAKPPKGVKIEPVPIPPIEDTAPPMEPVLTPLASVSVGEDTEGVAQPYRFPDIQLLTATRPVFDHLSGKNEEELKYNAERLIAVMQSFAIGASILTVTRGPAVTRYEIEPEAGVKLSSLTSRADDIALSLGATGVHIAPVPGKANVVGIEVPNRMVSTVYIRDLIDSQEFRAMNSSTSFVLGRDITGQNIVSDMTKLTHLLIAGTTGSGKSVCMNTLILSMLYKASPEDLRFIMIDPKMVELGVYNGIPHLLSPVVTEPKRAAEALAWAVSEMDSRYDLLMQRGKREIVSYNEEITREGGAAMPRIVVIIDEMADLMMVAHKEVETAVARIAQKARACGVHLILATQRPEAKVVTGIIKANIPSRIAFAVKGNLDSRIILDSGGAEKLVGRGDMLYLPVGAPKPSRVQGCFVSDEEVSRVVEYIKGSSSANYSDDMLAHLEQRGAGGGDGLHGGSSSEGADPMLPAAIEAIIESGQGSTSYLQRRLKLGYARAARLMDEMEERGIVGPFEGSKPRAVLITPEEWEEMK